MHQEFDVGVAFFWTLKEVDPGPPYPPFPTNPHT